MLEVLKEDAMSMQSESHCEGAAAKSASTHILGVMALQKISRAEHSNISNALCCERLQKVAGGNREIVKCQIQRTEQNTSAIGRLILPLAGKSYGSLQPRDTVTDGGYGLQRVGTSV